jgi:hypothetical protein
MSNIESLLAHRIKQSSALIARVRPLVESAAAAARKREIGDPVVVLADSMRWRRRLIVALAELNESSDRMALTDPATTPPGERQMLSALQKDMSNLIETIAQLTAALMPRRSGRPLQQ